MSFHHADQKVLGPFVGRGAAGVGVVAKRANEGLVVAQKLGEHGVFGGNAAGAGFLEAGICQHLLHRAKGAAAQGAGAFGGLVDLTLERRVLALEKFMKLAEAGIDLADIAQRTKIGIWRGFLRTAISPAISSPIPK